MRILSWNLNCIRKKNAFRYALESLKADIYFFQECYHPLTYLTKSEYNNFIGKYVWEPTENGWGNCILSTGNLLNPVGLDTKFKGRILLSKLKGKPLLFINLHVPITGNHSIHNLRSIFNEIRPFCKNKQTIVAGDLNFGKFFDKKGRTYHQDCLRDLLIQNGLISCFHKFHQEEKQTFRAVRKESECMIDYIFVTNNMEGYLKSCDVLKNSAIVTMSDHNSIYVEITSAALS